MRKGQQGTYCRGHVFSRDTRLALARTTFTQVRSALFLKGMCVTNVTGGAWTTSRRAGDPPSAPLSSVTQSPPARLPEVFQRVERKVVQLLYAKEGRKRDADARDVDGAAVTSHGWYIVAVEAAVACAQCRGSCVPSTSKRFDSPSWFLMASLQNSMALAPGLRRPRGSFGM